MKICTKIFGGGVIALLFVLQGCELNVSEDPFEEVEEIQTEILTGEIFLFDISVATEATHRLEKDGKLVALLASDIVNLKNFEGRKVSLSGTFKEEKMREIFWVKALELTDVSEEELLEKTHERFLTKDFSFVFPEQWEYTTSSDGTAYFSEKEDSEKRIFLNFSVKTTDLDEGKKDPNISIAGLSGYKEPQSDTGSREQENIVLFSNISDKKFTFLFTSQFEDFEKKKEFFSLLNSFIEGEEAVVKAKEADLKKQAERLLKKIEKEEERKILEELAEEGEDKNEDKDGLISKIIDKISSDESLEKEESEIVDEIVEERTEEAVEALWSFNNLVDARAYPYESQALRFSLKAPFGYWFKNFGGVEGRVGMVGFAKKDFSLLSEADFVLEILKKEGGITEKILKESDGELILQFPRNGFENSYFQLRGSPEWKDAILSVHSTIRSH